MLLARAAGFIFATGAAYIAVLDFYLKREYMPMADKKSGGIMGAVWWAVIVVLFVIGAVVAANALGVINLDGTSLVD